MYYSRYGHLKAVGAAAVSSVVIDAEDKDWFKVEGYASHCYYSNGYVWAEITLTYVGSRCIYGLTTGSLILRAVARVSCHPEGRG